MRTNIPEKLLKIVEEIDENGNASLTKLTVLKKWLERPERLSAFAIWVASRATSRKGKTVGPAAELFRLARTLLADVDKIRPKVDRPAAQALHNCLRDYQNEHQNQHWGPVRIIRKPNINVLARCRQP
jgi:hypothetical protein